MITLFSYPPLFGVPDNNGYGLKIAAVLRLGKLAFRHEHVLDASAAPRGQLPYITDGGEMIGDSEAIIAHLTAKHGLAIDAGLSQAQRDTALATTRLLDDLYWVMSYSRWQDDAYWPRFRAAFLREHAEVSGEILEKARAFNFQRYHFQGIGRYAPADAYRRGLADLGAIARLVPEAGFVFGPDPGTIDAAIYGFVANIHYYDIDTPLRRFVAGQPHLVRHCQALHAVTIA
jgi:glutathione S-transferase